MISISENTDYLLKAVSAALEERDAPLPGPGVDFKSLYEFADEQRLAAAAYHGLYRLGLDYKDMEPFKKAHRQSVVQSLMADREFARISRAFEEHGLDHCPLKGFWTRELYPDRTMRKMSDIDILIRREDTEAFHAVLLELGYECTRYLANDEDVYECKGMTVEIHRKLDDHGLENAEYYADPWRFAERVSGRLFKLRREDAYLFTLAHTMKHFMYSGIGLRPLADILLFMRKADLNRAYVEAEAKKMGISDFMHAMERTALAAFGGAERDEASLEIISFMASSGIKGTKENFSAATYLRSRSKLGYYLRVVFPDMETMKVRDPILVKAPVLLPFMYVRRWFQLLFTNRESMHKGLDQIKHANPEEAERLRRIHKLAGIKK